MQIQDLKDAYFGVKSRLKEGVCLVAVSKTKPIAYIERVYECGQRVFGENKALEMRDKYYSLPKDIEWHFIGHLQSNKIKYIAPYVSLIHSVDSLELLKEINKYAIKNSRVIEFLLEIKVAQEESKFGLDIESARQIIKSEDFAKLSNVELRGIMTMASNVEDKEQIREEFRKMRLYFEELKAEFANLAPSFDILSMGMTQDFDIAMEEGANMVRVGSAIFGERNIIGGGAA